MRLGGTRLCSRSNGTVHVLATTTQSAKALTISKFTPFRQHAIRHSTAGCKARLQSYVGCISSGIQALRKSSAKPKRQSRAAFGAKAMIQIDYSQPAIWLGLTLVGGGLGLYQLRRASPVLSKDSDVVVSSVLIFSGGILMFQGWRLDPLLLFCQLLIAGTALNWALEAINLRKTLDNNQQFDERMRQYPALDDERQRGRRPKQSFSLPPARDSEEYGRWYRDSDEAEFEEVPSVSGRGFYDGRGQDSYYPQPSISGRGDEAEDYEGDARYMQDARYEQLDYRDRQSNLYRDADYNDAYNGYEDQYSQNDRYENEQYDPSEYGSPGDEQSRQQDWEGGGPDRSQPRVVGEVENFYNTPGNVMGSVESFYGNSRNGDTDEDGSEGAYQQEPSSPNQSAPENRNAAQSGDGQNKQSYEQFDQRLQSVNDRQRDTGQENDGS